MAHDGDETGRDGAGRNGTELLGTDGEKGTGRDLVGSVTESGTGQDGKEQGKMGRDGTARGMGQDAPRRDGR